MDHPLVDVGALSPALKPIPDTRLVREASDLAASLLSPAVLAHSRRTFHLGRAYAVARSIRFDEEGLALAALFHDVGLCDRLRDGGRPFTEVSAAELAAFLAERGDPRGPILGEAIELHMKLFPRFGRGPVVGLLQVGAWMDVMGLRRGRVGRQVVGEIEAALPRDGFAGEFRRRLLSSLGSFRACARLLFPRRRREG